MDYLFGTRNLKIQLAFKYALVAWNFNLQDKRERIFSLNKTFKRPSSWNEWVSEKALQVVKWTVI